MRALLGFKGIQGMRLSRFAYGLVIGVSLFASVGVARGLEVPGLFNTGVDETGMVVVSGVDPGQRKETVDEMP